MYLDIITQKNKNKLKYIFSALFFTFVTFSSFNIYAQVEDEDINEDTEKETELRIERLAEETEDQLDYTDLLEQLDYLQKHPINLNKTNYDELKQIPFLTDIQINNLLGHIREHGKLASVYELQTIDGFTPDVIDRLLPFISVSEDVKGSTLTFNEILKNSKSDLFLRVQRVIEDQKGYSAISDSALQASPNSRYLGSPERLYTRFRIKYYNNLSLGFTAEKDPGEEFFQGTQKNGYDFYSAHFFVKDMWGVKALAIGDYLAQFGQGLTLWTGLSFGKSADAVFIKKSPMGLKASTSSDENRYMRGAAATVDVGMFEVTGFYSKKNIGANIKSELDSLMNEDVFVSSFDETGIHATPSEMNKRKSLGENIFGGRIAYRTDRVHVGITGVRYIYDVNIQKTFQTYKQFEFTGKDNTVLGLDYNYVYRNINFFGEMSRSQNGGMAFLNGLMVSLDPSVTFSVLHRDYAKDFQNFYTAGFAEGSNTYNEKGIYFGLETKFSRRWILRSYVDNFWFPWLKSSTTGPSKGTEYLSELHYIPSRKLSMYVRAKIENKQENNTAESNMINYLQIRNKQNYRYHIAYQITPTLSLKNRFEYVVYTKGDEKSNHGYLVYQDASYKPKKFPVSFNMRYAIFNTDSYNAALYAYESDVLYAYSVPSYYYKGSRAFIVLKYHISRNLDFWLRYSRTYYTNKDVIGSGLTEIQGSHKSEFKAQVRLRF